MRRQVLIVGDNGVGKTSIITTVTCKRFVQDYIATIANNDVTIEVDNKLIILTLLDTVAQKEYDRPYYSRANVFVICFSVTSISSFENIRDKWYPEVHHLRPQVPIILVGTKIDLRNENEVLLITTEQHKSINERYQCS